MTATSVAAPCARPLRPRRLRRRPPARVPRRAAPHAARLLAGHARRARATGRCSSTPTSCASPASRSCSRRARAAWCSRTSTPSRLEHDAEHAAGDGPAAPRRLPAAARARASRRAVIASHGGPDPRHLPRDHAPRPREQGDVEFVHDVTAPLPTQVDRRAHGPARGRLGPDPPAGRAEHQRPGPRHRGATRDADGVDESAATARSTWRCTRSQFAAPAPRRGTARGPHHAHPRRRLRRRPDDRHRLRQLLRAARHRRQRHHQDDALVRAARAARSTPTSWPSCAPTRRSSRARSRRSCATRTRCTTSGAPRPPTPSCAASTSPRATRW